MLNKEFWNDRAVRYGHTGHTEPFLYSFDQEARKFAVEKILAHLFTDKKDKALDYGCGSGDFSEILKEKFSLVVAYDISEKVLQIAQHTHGTQIKFTSDKRAVRDNSLYDLILSVTVLQQLEEQDLHDAVKEFSLLLSNSGYILAVEFFVNDEWNAINNEKRITNSAWKEILEKNGLSIVSKHAFYDAALAPSASWHEYNSNLFLRILRVFKNSDMARRIFVKKAREIIHKRQDVLGVENNTCYIYILQKVHAD